jgi:hypothetical protein
MNTSIKCTDELLAFIRENNAHHLVAAELELFYNSKDVLHTRVKLYPTAFTRLSGLKLTRKADREIFENRSNVSIHLSKKTLVAKAIVGITHSRLIEAIKPIIEAQEKYNKYIRNNSNSNLQGQISKVDIKLMEYKSVIVTNDGLSSRLGKIQYLPDSNEYELGYHRISFDETRRVLAALDPIDTTNKYSPSDLILSDSAKARSLLGVTPEQMQFINSNYRVKKQGPEFLLLGNDSDNEYTQLRFNRLAYAELETELKPRRANNMDLI